MQCQRQGIAGFCQLVQDHEGPHFFGTGQEILGRIDRAMPKSVVPEIHAGKTGENFMLCRVTGVQAVSGRCVVHDSDACVSMYVRYNHVFETMERNFKDAMVKTRRDVS